MMQHLVDTYECEWAAVVRDPEKRRRFRQFVNTDETESCIEIVTERGQSRPADWPSEFVSLEQFRMLDGRSLGEHERQDEPPLRWVPVGYVDDFPLDGGATVKYGKSQIAVFNFASRGEWYATQNMCPHKKAFVLSRGIVGTRGREPKVACPLHKKTFSLETGESLQGEEYRIRTFRVKVENGTGVRRAAAAGSARSRDGHGDRLQAGVALSTAMPTRSVDLRRRQCMSRRT